MLPATIAQVIESLVQIMDDCEKRQDPLGYFAALYHKVTCRVQQGIAAGEFEDGPRMERFDVQFANRYLQAWHAFQHGEHTTKSWLVAFGAAKKRSTLILQHLLLGMNAHINLDLGIVAAEIAKTQGLPAVRKDYAAINGILAMLTGDVMNELRRVSPLLSLMGLHAGRQQSMLIQFSLSNARDGAWVFAEELFDANESTRQQIVEARDTNIAQLAESILATTGLMKLTAGCIRLFECKRPRRVIQILRNSNPSFIKAKQLNQLNNPG